MFCVDFWGFTLLLIELLSLRYQKAVQGDQALFSAGWILLDRHDENDGSFGVKSKGKGVQLKGLRSYGPEDKAIGLTFVRAMEVFLPVLALEPALEDHDG